MPAKSVLIILFLFFVLSEMSFAQEDFGISPPEFSDAYSEKVRELESGKTDIDYLAFRESFLESRQYSVASGKFKEYDSLKKKMREHINNKEYSDVVKVCKGMLNIDYTDMNSHKILQQTYKVLGDSVKSAKYKTIEFGLLNSIVKNGDGKTCATAWPVIQVNEEYFILKMLGAELLEQSVDHKGGTCDRMEVKLDGKKKVYYFDVSRVFAQYKKMFKKD